MARIIGPLFSQEARGQFGKSVVFTRRRGQNVARGYVIPANPQTANQVAVRITLAISGIVSRRVRATNWTYAGEANTWIQFWSGRVTTGEVWNSALVSAMIGPGRATYTAALAAYNALSAAEQLLWTNAAETGTVGLTDYTRGTTTVEAGFMLYLAELATASAGYGNAFDPTTPVDVDAG